MPLRENNQIRLLLLLLLYPIFFRQYLTSPAFEGVTVLTRHKICSFNPSSTRRLKELRDKAKQSLTRYFSESPSV